MASNTPADFIQTFRSQLETTVQADTAFGSGFPVLLVAEGATGLDEAVVLIRPETKITLVQNYIHVGGTQRDEDFTVPGVLWVKATGKPDGVSTVFQAAMDRAQALLDHVIQELRDSPPAVGVQTFTALVAESGFEPAPIDQGWGVICEFDIEATVRVA